MIAINTPAEARELVALAAEIQSQDALLTWREAFHYACAELPIIIEDIQAGVCFVPAKVVWFDDAGQPARLTARELMTLTGDDRGH